MKILSVPSIPFALALLAAPISSRAAEAAPATPAVTAMPVDVYVARQDGVVVRRDPGFVYREITRLARGEEINVDGRSGEWLRVVGGGWVLGEQVWTKAQAAAAPPPATRLVVVREGARVRATPSTDAAVVRTLKAGEAIAASAQQDGWWQLEDGGFVSAALVKREDLARGAPAATATSGGRMSASPVASGKDPRRWSLMDLGGTLIEIYEIGNPALIEGMRSEMAATGVLEPDWTFLGLTIGVPRDATYKFRYSPDGNKIVVTDRQGQRYGNVYARGPIGRMPEHVRALLDRHEVLPGERFDGVVLFRPTLKVEDIAAVSVEVEGREQKLIEAR